MPRSFYVLGTFCNRLLCVPANDLQDNAGKAVGTNVQILLRGEFFAAKIIYIGAGKIYFFLLIHMPSNCIYIVNNVGFLLSFSKEERECHTFMAETVGKMNGVFDIQQWNRDFLRRSNISSSRGHRLVGLVQSMQARTQSSKIGEWGLHIDHLFMDINPFMDINLFPPIPVHCISLISNGG
jgi:hypothetical protein